MTDQYDIIFEGKTAPGKEIDSVKQALMKLLKADAGRVEQLFVGKPVSIRKNVDAATAEKYRKALEAAGALCHLRPINGAGSRKTSDRPEATPAPAPPKTKPAPRPAPAAKAALDEPIIITNIENVPGKSIVEHFGLVSGSTIRAKHIGRDIMASFKNLVGGQIKGYTELLQESREQALSRMIEQATELGANAVVNVRFSTSSIAQGAAELYAYGTAVRVE
jgi:uncharacterized protein YbjQ (UPF0145 family)